MINIDNYMSKHKLISSKLAGALHILLSIERNMIKLQVLDHQEMNRWDCHSRKNRQFDMHTGDSNNQKNNFYS